MGKYFLGSVGKAEAFRKGPDGKLTLAFVSKTLTDSGLNISTSKDDIRAGEGAPIQFSFYHDANVEITLTDVLWRREYLEAQLGVKMAQSAANTAYKTATVEGTEGTLTITDTAEALPFPCEGENKICWFAEQGTDNWHSATVGEGGEVKSNIIKAGVKYCVRYLTKNSKARVAEITSSIIPEELFLVITAPIFAGDACSASKGKAAGHITYEIPRFQLNGSQDFTMNMSSNQTMSLSGTAMASESLDCNSNAGKLLRIIEVIDDEKWYEDVESLIVDEESTVSGSAPIVYGLKKDGSVVLAPVDGLLHSANGEEPWTPCEREYVFPSSDVYLNINDGNGKAVLGVGEKVTLSK